MIFSTFSTYLSSAVIICSGWPNQNVKKKTLESSQQQKQVGRVLTCQFSSLLLFCFAAASFWLINYCTKHKPNEQEKKRIINTFLAVSFENTPHERRNIEWIYFFHFDCVRVGCKVYFSAFSFSWLFLASFNFFK